jgi:cell fate (sporulation/competence/biofilm development) regulator YlbF (YheA/YmcA/DUF963 family)
MELTVDELKAVSHYFNRQVDLSSDLRELAAKMKDKLHPTVVVEEVKKVSKKK